MAIRNGYKKYVLDKSQLVRTTGQPDIRTTVHEYFLDYNLTFVCFGGILDT